MNTLQRKRYPTNWDVLASQCKERANWQCEHCGVAQFTSQVSKRGVPYYVYLHAAHRRHDTDNPQPELIALCPTCHARYDYENKQRAARVRLERIKHLRLLIERGIVALRYDEPESGWLVSLSAIMRPAEVIVQ